ncbi:MAG: thioredoxin TrxC [Halopseudomonas sp.]
MTDSLHLPCPDCAGINRIPASRLGDDPKCGRCRSPLFQAKPVELTSANFQTHVQRSDIPVLVDFWAPWCGPCKIMGPAFQSAALQLEPQFRLSKVNTEEEADLGARLVIRSIPTLVLFQHGKEVARQAGAMGQSDIVRWAQSQIKP